MTAEDTSPRKADDPLPARSTVGPFVIEVREDYYEDGPWMSSTVWHVDMSRPDGPPERRSFDSKPTTLTLAGDEVLVHVDDGRCFAVGRKFPEFLKAFHPVGALVAPSITAVSRKGVALFEPGTGVLRGELATGEESAPLALEGDALVIGEAKAVSVWDCRTLERLARQELTMGDSPNKARFVEPRLVEVDTTCRLRIRISW